MKTGWLQAENKGNMYWGAGKAEDNSTYSRYVAEAELIEQSSGCIYGSKMPDKMPEQTISSGPGVFLYILYWAYFTDRALSLQSISLVKVTHYTSRANISSVPLSVDLTAIRLFYKSLMLQHPVINLSLWDNKEAADSSCFLNTSLKWAGSYGNFNPG